jgi:transposase
MWETITMTSREQQRAQVLTRLLVGEVTAAEAAVLLGLSERQVFRLRAGYERDGPAALVHGNRGRASSRRLDPGLAARIVELARTTYEGVNDCHLAELLAEHEGITISRSSLRRLLRRSGRPSPRRRRAPRHRSRRDRMPQAGMLLQVDGSRHDWLEDRGPRLTLTGAIDDATGRMTGATFREQEDTAGYLLVLRDTVGRYGIPLAVYRDRHGLFETPKSSLMTLEEQLADTRVPTQLGRAFEELGITSIAARSPQAKGRIERAWGTFQDRLVSELRLAGADDLVTANAVLARFLPRFNRRFAVPAADPAPAWRPLPAGLRVDQVCCLKYRRVVANDHTVRVGASILQLPPGPGRRGYAGRRVEVQLRLDGRIVVWDGERELLAVPAPADPVQLRALESARPEVGSAAPSAAYRSGTIPAPDHPWRRMPVNARRESTRLTESRSR